MDHRRSRSSSSGRPFIEKLKPDKNFATPKKIDTSNSELNDITEESKSPLNLELLRAPCFLRTFALWLKF